ncbi:MAG: hypothetical protein ACKVKF_22665, partial [Rhodobacterales bacterium]
NVQVVMAQGPSQSDQGGRMRDVTPRSDRRMRPADVRLQIEQNQRLNEDDAQASDGDTRTDEASD